MALQYTSIADSDFSLGIDARSAENQIAPGFVRDLLNADIVERRIRKRAGYQGFAGNEPVRVASLEYDAAEQMACFILPSGTSLENIGISLETTPASPIVVYGRSSLFESGDGPFTDTDSVHYYNYFTIPIRHELSPGNSPLTILEAEHGLPTTNLFVEVVESLSNNNRSYSKFKPDSIRIDESTFDVSIDYTVASTVNSFVYFAQKEPETGSTFVDTYTRGTGVQTITIPATGIGGHSLSNFNIVSKVYLDTGSEQQEVEIDEFLLDSSGEVTITVTNDTGSSQDYTVILSSAPIANSATGTVNAGATGTIVLSNVTSPWAFYSIYLADGTDLYRVEADTIEYDDTTKELTYTFTNEGPVATSYVIYYEFGSLRANKLCVEDVSVTTDGLDERPQITIWGLSHDEIYLTPKADREGWVNHVDSYRRSGEQRLISGLGGNLFSAQTYEEAATQYAYAQLYPRLHSRTSAAGNYGPLFWDTGETPARTHGYITGDDSGTHWATVTAVEFDTGNGWTKYTLSLPNKAILDSTGTPTAISNVISTTSGLEDWLTIERMSYARHEGTFRIRQVQDGTNEILIWVENDSNSADYDDDGVGGQAGVFTDRLPWAASYYIPGDILNSTSLGIQVNTVVSSTLTQSVVDGWSDITEIPSGVTFNGTRTSSVIPLRGSYPLALDNTDNLVRGDMLSYTGIDRLVRVQSLNADSDSWPLTITSDGETATAVVSSGSPMLTNFLTAGNKVLLLNAGVYTGVQTITEVISTDSFSFSTTESDSESGTLLNNTMEVDEELTWADSSGDTNVFTVDRRWIPVEAPDDEFDLTPTTYVRHFDFDEYTAQSFIRSTMVVDNLYLTNGNDEVFKFDGGNIYRAGLPSWQPGLFASPDYTATAKIATDLRSVPYSVAVGDDVKGRLTLTNGAADQNIIPVGSTIRLNGSSQSYTVQAYTQDDPVTPTTFYAIVDRALDADVDTPGSMSESGIFRYYFRLNAVDPNNNIIASATTGYQDHVVELFADAAINLKLIGLPAWDIYDYDRLEVQIYRTKMNTQAPFYLVTTLAMNFDNTEGYLQFTDAFADDDLTELDVVNTALKGAELGTGWSDPLRSKYITSIGNRQVLANIRDYPQLDISLVGDATVDSTVFNTDRLLFRRDNTDTGTVVDMNNRVEYEWRNTYSAATSNFVIGTDTFTFDTNIAVSTIVGSWIYLSFDTTFGGGPVDLTYSGWWQVAASVNGLISTITVNLKGAAPAATYPNRICVGSNSLAVPVYIGSADENMGMVNGVSFDIFNATRKLGMAINASMRMVDTSLGQYAEFTPWLMARSGNDTPPGGRIIIRQPRTDATTFEMVPTFSGYEMFVNSVRRSTGDQISAATRVYPSRLLVSYPNYAEIFDNPTVILDTDSDSAIDINPADGQEITGVIPFFGEAAFTAAQQAAILVVFKTNSIYLVDINQKVVGQNAVQRIETEGLGCTAPYSIAVTKSGIMFANESGIYCLRRSQAIEYIGRYMERNWTERTDLDALSIVHGHHYGIGRSYKISVPLIENIDPNTGYVEPSEAFVYNHTGEAEGRQGAWGRYDNHPAIGWANLSSDAFYASTRGRVFSVRNTGTVSDYRDDNEAVSMSLETRPFNFGDTGRRKVVDKIFVDYRVGAENTGTSLLFSPDLEVEYQETTPFTVPKPSDSSNLSDAIARDIVTIGHNIGRRRCIYISIQITNETLDENVEISGMTFNVAGLSERGILSAAQTR